MNIWVTARNTSDLCFNCVPTFVLHTVFTDILRLFHLDKKKKECRWFKHHWHGLEKRYCFVSCTNPWMQRHTTSHLEDQIREAFEWGSDGWEAELCTPPGVLLRHSWGLCSMSHLICNLYASCCGYDGM